jgi:hypothetical protein
MPQKARMGKILEISLPSEELRKRIKDAAKARGCTTSKYLVSLFEEAGSPARPAPGQDVQILREENRTLAGLLHETKRANEQLNAELRRIQSSEVLKPEGSGQIDEELLILLKAGPAMHDYRLLATLNIEPGSEAAQAAARQLQFLETTGFVSRTSRGWSWKK